MTADNKSNVRRKENRDVVLYRGALRIHRKTEAVPRPVPAIVSMFSAAFTVLPRAMYEFVTLGYWSLTRRRASKRLMFVEKDGKRLCPRDQVSRFVRDDARPFVGCSRELLQSVFRPCHRAYRRTFVFCIRKCESIISYYARYRVILVAVVIGNII